MPGSYRVVPASAGHVSVLPEIERSAASRFRDCVPAQLLDSVTPESVFSAAQSDGMLWVALGSDDEPVGFSRAVVAGTRVHLAELDVLPEHGRRGVGSALVGAVESWARSNGYSAITLTTYRDVPWNAPFYSGLGFEVVPEAAWDALLRDAFEQEVGLESERVRRVVMRKRLGTAQDRA